MSWVVLKRTIGFNEYALIIFWRKKEKEKKEDDQSIAY